MLIFIYHGLLEHLASLRLSNLTFITPPSLNNSLRSLSNKQVLNHGGKRGEKNGAKLRLLPPRAATSARQFLVLLFPRFFGA